MAAWNVTICSSASSLLKMNSKSRIEQVLGMLPSPQVSPSTANRGGGGRGGEQRVMNEDQQRVGVSPKRGYYAAFAEMADEEMVVEEEVVGGSGGVVLKKRRLSVEQVRFLESSFESENKLEPERKAQIAQRLGLQPRQVAVWFQNRRARSKSKQLERDFLTLKADYEAVLLENEKLQAEVDRLTAQLREGNVPLQGGQMEAAKDEPLAKEAKATGSNACSSSNRASEGPTSIKAAGEEGEAEVSTASVEAVRGNGAGNGAGDEEEQLSVCTVNVNMSASILPLSLPSTASGRAKVAEGTSTNSYEALVSEEFQIFTDSIQQALSHELVDFYADSLTHYDNGLFITSLDDPWGDS